jgi:hypothetical protein
MSDFTLEDLVNMKLDDAQFDYDDSPPKRIRHKKKKKQQKVETEESSEEEPPKPKVQKCPMSSKLREVVIIYVLFVVFSCKLSAGQVDKLLKISSADYSIYDLLVRGIAMTLFFFILCRLFR